MKFGFDRDVARVAEGLRVRGVSAYTEYLGQSRIAAKKVKMKYKEPKYSVTSILV
jgi:hypothetical protein